MSVIVELDQSTIQYTDSYNYNYCEIIRYGATEDKPVYFFVTGKK